MNLLADCIILCVLVTNTHMLTTVIISLFCLLVSVRRAARRYGLREAVEGEDWTLFWTDCSVSLDRVKDMKRYQVFHRICPHTIILKDY